jgi:hypothetical protein
VDTVDDQTSSGIASTRCIRSGRVSIDLENTILWKTVFHLIKIKGGSRGWRCLSGCFDRLDAKVRSAAAILLDLDLAELAEIVDDACHLRLARMAARRSASF